MSWLNALKDIADVGKALLGVTANAVSRVVTEAKQFVDKAWKVAQKTFRGEPESEKERLERDLQEVNERIQRLRQRHRERGGLTSTERREWEHLKQQRSELNASLREVEQGSNAETIVEQEEDYGVAKITDTTVHVLQYHVGQSTFNKICECGRTMVLQWNRNLATPGLKDFFWGCSGWYEQRDGQRACELTCALTESDSSLFSNLSRPEFAVSPQLLAQVSKDRAGRVRAALESIRDQHRQRKMGLGGYRCPIHGERLVLRRQLERGKGILDEYFLGCPRWSRDGFGCSFLVKLKSAAQLSSVLNIGGEGGLLSVSGEPLNTRASKNAGKKWTAEEEARLIEAYRSGVPISQLSQQHQRDVGGIRSRLSKLGLMNPSVIRDR